MGRYVINDYPNAQEAQVAALDSVIEWFEDDESHDVYTDQDEVEQCIKQLEAYKLGVKDGQYDSDDVLEVSGFTIKSL